MLSDNGKSVVLAPAKINIGLEIGRRKEEMGLHPIKTIMIPVSLYDRLMFSSIEEGVEIVSDDSIPLDHRNTCYKAYSIFKESFEMEEGVRVEIEKNIPVGAGLGGGSSDAAETLKYLSKKSGDEVTTEDLLEMSVRIGRDVPFFILSQPAFATGYGEALTPIEVDTDFWVVIAWVDDGVLTKDAYARYDEWLEDGEKLKEYDWNMIFNLLLEGKLVKLYNMVGNDFEGVIFDDRGDLKELKGFFYDWGVDYASMTGSGCSVYGLTHCEYKALEILERLKKIKVNAEIVRPVLENSS